METKAFFNSLAESWDKDIPAFLPSRNAAAILSGACPGARVLDIACGTGVMTPELLALGVASLTGIDLAEKMIERAREKFSGEARVSFVAGDLMEYEGGPFDLALMYNAYPHFPDKNALLAKVASLLAPGGRFTVAHGAGRQVINNHHRGSASAVSVPLLPAAEEALAWKEHFEIDTLVDRDAVYIISGVKQAG